MPKSDDPNSDIGTAGDRREEFIAVLDAMDADKAVEDAVPDDKPVVVEDTRREDNVVDDSGTEETQEQEQEQEIEDQEIDEPTEDGGWVTDEIQRVADAYEFTPDLMANIESEDEFRKYVQFVDQLESSRKRPEPNDGLAKPTLEPSKEEADDEDAPSWTANLHNWKRMDIRLML